MTSTTRVCAYCLDPVEETDVAGRYVHAWMFKRRYDHRPLVACPHCGAQPKVDRVFTGRDLLQDPFNLAGVAFWGCRECGRVWHRHEPDTAERAKVEKYFLSMGAEADGTGYDLAMWTKPQKVPTQQRR